MNIEDRLRALTETLARKGRDPFWKGLALGVALTLGLGYWYHSNRVEAFEENVRRANAEAQGWELAWNETQQAFEERAYQVLDHEQLEESLRAENEDLADALENAEARVLSITRTNTRLKARLDSSATSVAREDSTTYRVDLDERVTLQGGGFVRALGTILLETTGPTTETDLTVEGEFPLTVVLSRGPDQGIRVNAFTGDPRLSVTQLDVERLAERPAESGVGGALDAIGQHLTDGSVWLGRIEGAGACLLFNALSG